LLTYILLKKYNPELQKRALAQRESRQQEFDSFVSHLKEASKSDKPSMLLIHRTVSQR